ncbi:MAG: HNH endonuclease [Oscillatoria sp. Prado101]|nr:HNH endonuclease [Oscillatoria sp. Prado101]
MAQGGLNDISNLQHLHKPCHKQVHSKTKQNRSK